MDGIFVVRYEVGAEELDVFETWKSKMELVIRTFRGYKNIIDIHASPNNAYHYVVVRFDSTEHANAWKSSEERKTMLEDLGAMWLSSKEEAIHEWDTFWLSKMVKAKKWKQWLVTLMAVYPLTIVVPVVVNFIETLIPLSYFAGILRAIFISAAMIFFLMPFMIGVFKKWLQR
ncbi:hypothetical protein CNR22_19855 [Sphingobacteriaceae bacterium]|nr:hypothetical protein CNR22_19855 [Sphingobacteriaceae bacterium]